MLRARLTRRPTTGSWAAGIAAAALCALGATTVGATTAGAAGAAPPGLRDPLPGALPFAPFSVGTRVVAAGYRSPTGATSAPGVADRLFVTDQPGVIYSVGTGRRAGSGPGTVFADLRSRIVPLADVEAGSQYDERGLLGLAFDPDYQETGKVYTYTTQPYRGRADFSTEPGTARNCRAYDPVYVAHPCQNVVTEWRVHNPRDPRTTIDLGTARELLRIDKPEFNHNAGALAFGPDGFLYISTGDGGFGDDQGLGHDPGGNAQSLAPGNVLGKILRINPRGRDSANGQYGIPRTNPFIGRPGADEIFAYGFRNPYRMAFDPVTGKLWTGDTGQNEVEEVDVVTAGGNYGWHVKEGTFAFAPGSPADPEDGTVTRNSAGSPAALTDPVAEYDHTGPHGSINGEAIVGGAVYRGTEVPQLAGLYVFGDYSPGADEGKPVARLFIARDDGRPAAANTFALDLSRGRNDLGLFLLGFGRDGNGEMYVLGNKSGTLAGRTGVVELITAS